jgi:predicted nucleotidyltransferase
VNIRAREGDFIETFVGAFFDVKGLVHPPGKVIAFIRYFPGPSGDRKRDGITYQKVYALSERYALLKRAFPPYLVYDPVFDEFLCEVPTEDVKKHYQPINRWGEFRRKGASDETERLALTFVVLLKEAKNVPWRKLGISGSILVGLHTSTSDIYPVIYGSENCRKVHAALKTLLEDEKSPVKTYDLEGLKSLFNFRSGDTAMSFENFVRTESRKALQGKFMGRDYFIRCVKDWDEVKERYGAVRYRAEGYAKIKAQVMDDSEAIFTPCRYRIENVEILEGVRVKPIKEIASFRGRFCEQAKISERVIAQGKVERVQEAGKSVYYRLLLGNKKSDFMVPLF